MASKNVFALANRIQQEFGLSVEPDNYVTTHAGRHLRAGGAFTWFFFSDKHPYIVGGFSPMRKYLVKRNLLDISKTRWNEYEVDVYCPGELYYNKLRKMCKNRECEPPVGGVEDCEFYNEGVCIADIK